MPDPTRADSSAWPPHKYEVRWRVPDEGVFRDCYHFAPWARKAADNLRESGRALQIRVVRLDDGELMYDPDNEIELPIEEW